MEEDYHQVLQFHRTTYFRYVFGQPFPDSSHNNSGVAKDILNNNKKPLSTPSTPIGIVLYEYIQLEYL
jgi:hypothetical protein